MKMEMLVLSILTAGFITVPSFAAQTGCCAAMSGHDADPARTNTIAEALPQPVATVFDNYSRIQTALAQDSVQDVAKEAQAIAKAVHDDAMATFPPNVAQQARAVAKASDLSGAREAFKPLSQSLIAYVSKHPAPAGSWRQVHCSMANADWLQKESTAANPYLGKEMLHCGEFVKNNDNGKHGQ